MKFMNLNKWRLCEEANAEGSEDVGAAPAETETDATPEETTDTPEGIKLGDDDTNTDDIKLSDKEPADKEGEQANDAPESYDDFTMPEGIEVNQDLLEAALPVFKELNLSQDQAQKLVDLQADSVKGAQEAMAQQHVDTVSQWKTALHSDKDIGGDKLNESLANAKLFLKTHGDAETIKYLDDSGLSNHPGLLKMFSKSGALMREDNPGAEHTITKPSGSPEQNRATLLYSKSE